MITRAVPRRADRNKAGTAEAPPSSPTASAAPGRWRIDAAASTLQIRVTVGFIATVTGRFTDVRGHLDLGCDVRDSAITVQVDTASLTSGSMHWDSVLMAAGLVDSAANPAISFRSTAVTPRGTGWLLAGQLVTARGCLSVRFDLSGGVSGAEELRFRATGSIASEDAVRLLSRPGVERLIGRSVGVDLTLAAVREVAGEDRR